ncbi:MAG: 30S ribosomal protein S13 [Candidatus ainarchaeum sp.]|nr:30S ribosomal protein S13 [Candidatus ainarchaeum sp.]
MFGEVPLKMAVLRVRGIGHTTGNAVARLISNKFSIPDNTEVGDLSESQLSEIDNILMNVSKYLPHYLLNRRKDPETGKDTHVITNDLIFANRQDIEKEKKVYSWKGYRHAYGKKVRGQKTRNTGRHGRSVGVVKKSLQPGKAAPAAAAAPAAPKKEAKK